MPTTKIGFNMAVITRIDARSANNKSLKVCDSHGNVLCEIEAATTKGVDNTEKFRHQATLSISTSVGIHIVKSNGVMLGKK